MTVGALGKVAFEVSDSLVQTLSSLELSSSGTYSEHKNIGGAPVVEHTGRELDSIAFTAVFSAYLGADPVSEFEQLRKYAKNASAVSFVLGDKRFGRKWNVRSVKGTAKRFDYAGNVTQMEVSVTLKEYN